MTRPLKLPNKERCESDERKKKERIKHKKNMRVHIFNS